MHLENVGSTKANFASRGSVAAKIAHLGHVNQLDLTAWQRATHRPDLGLRHCCEKLHTFTGPVNDETDSYWSAEYRALQANAVCMRI